MLKSIRTSKELVKNRVLFSWKTLNVYSFPQVIKVPLILVNFSAGVGAVISFMLFVHFVLDAPRESGHGVTWQIQTNPSLENQG
jgi:hypothetical protein